MTAKKVRCNKRDECGVRGCPCYKKHLHDWACCDGFCYASGLTVKCVPVKPRKPSPAKPEKIWVVEMLVVKKWKRYGDCFKGTLGGGEIELMYARRDLPNVPRDEFRLREYTAGKVLKG